MIEYFRFDKNKKRADALIKKILMTLTEEELDDVGFLTRMDTLTNSCFVFGDGGSVVVGRPSSDKTICFTAEATALDSRGKGLYRSVKTDFVKRCLDCCECPVKLLKTATHNRRVVEVSCDLGFKYNGYLWELDRRKVLKLA